jgi:hypothetical protein
VVLKTKKKAVVLVLLSLVIHSAAPQMQSACVLVATDLQILSSFTSTFSSSKVTRELVAEKNGYVKEELS